MDMSLGSNIRNYRQQRKLTMSELALRCDIEQSNLSKLERDQVWVGKMPLQAIATTLGVTLSDLFAEEPNPSLGLLPGLSVPVLPLPMVSRWMTEGMARVRLMDECEAISTDRRYSPLSFAITIQGEAMQPMFDEGNIVIFDEAMKPRPGDYAIALDKNLQPHFGQYRDRGSGPDGQPIFDLAPLNPVYPTMHSDVNQLQIVGTMVEHRRFSRRLN
jgi:transcriptional regulator with XRE-family HTH domain